MLLNSHPGARYGIPFPVLARASFGVLGANVAAVLRALVACGWFGIQTWIGGEAINTLIATLAPALGTIPAQHGDLLSGVLADQSGRYSQEASNTSGFCRGSARRFCWRWAFCCWHGPTHRRADLGPCSRRHRASPALSDFLKFLIPALNAHGRFLGNRLAEYSGLSRALRAASGNR